MFSVYRENTVSSNRHTTLKRGKLKRAGLLWGTTLLCAFSMSVKAGFIKDIPAQFRIISAAQAVEKFEGLQTPPALFGADEKYSNDISAFTKWSDMFDRFEDLSRSKNGDNALLKIKADLSRLQKTQSIHQLAQRVNTLMNKKKYILDQDNWGKSDYWATPIEFMNRGGDCEDFAIAKYFALRALGVPESRLRVTIVQDLKKNIPHAVLVVYAENQTLILDNQSEKALPDQEIAHYRPIFSINREGWWLHDTPEQTTTIASAAQ